MSTTERTVMPWEQEKHELTKVELKQQLARILAIGALQRARKYCSQERKRQQGAGEGTSA